MSIKLGEMLIEAGLLTQSQLEATLKNQVIFGGKLGTNLIELGYISEENLARFLSKKLELPSATKEQLMSVHPDIIQLIPKEVADKYKVVPLGRERKRLTLAMLDPADLSVIDAISFITGYYISAVIAPELLLVMALEKYYGIKRDLRYIQIIEKNKTQPASSVPKEAEEAAKPFFYPEETDGNGNEAFDFSLPAGEEVFDIEELVETAAEPIFTEPAKVPPPIAPPPEAAPIEKAPAEMPLDILEPQIAEMFDIAPAEAEHFQASPEEFTPLRMETPPVEPVPVEPVPVEPVTVEPVTVEPVPVEPVTVEPLPVEPFTMEPLTVEPLTAEPFTAEPPPVMAEPLMAEPAITEPVKEAFIEIELPGEEPAESTPAELTADAVAEMLANAQDRDDIADIVTSYLGREFDRAVLFMVKGTVAEGWKGVRNNVPIPGIGMLQLPLDEPSVLHIVNEGKSFYLGPISEMPGNARMLAGIGGGTPSVALLVPLSIMGRVVVILYVDGGKGPVADRLSELQKLVGKVGMAFEILILKNKILMT